MARLIKVGRSNGGRVGIASNSLVLADGDLLAKSGGFVIKAGATGKIEGIATGAQTFASDNQTVAKTQVESVKTADDVVFEITITGGTITQADEGKFYNLTAGGIVDGATEAAASTEAAPRQLKMEKFISATLGRFVAVR